MALLNRNSTQNDAFIIDGFWLRPLQVVWVLLAVVTLALFTLGTVAGFRETAVSPTLAPILAQQTIISTQFYILYANILGIIRIAGFLAVMLFLVWRRPNDWLVLLFSMALITRGIGVTSIVRLAGQTYPNWEWLVDTIYFLGNVLPIAIFMTAPTGRFASRWFKLIFVLSIAYYFSWYLLPPELSTRYWPDMIRLPLDFGFFLVAILSQWYQYTRLANPVQKQQTKWMVYGTSIGIVLIILMTLVGLALENQSANIRIGYRLVQILLEDVLYISLPFIVVIAVLRYRLWDINFVLNRTIVYGALTAILGFIFFLSTLILSQVGSGLSLAITMLLLGALFQPIRQNLQRFVDRRFFDIQIDYQRAQREEKKLADFQFAIQGAHFGEYEIERPLGKGGMAEVFLASHPDLTQPVALKVLHPHLLDGSDFSKRFQREAEIVSNLEHPHIVRVFDFAQSEETAFMVMEYLQGHDVRSAIEASGQLSLTETCQIIQQIASALDYAHEQGLIHRDVKPSNIMLTERRGTHAILTDFGVVKQLQATTNLTHSGVVGTFDYMSPEQIKNEPDIDGRSDIYTLGVVTYHMLTGKTPFEGRNPAAILLAHLSQPAPDASHLRPDLPLATSTAIMRAMSKRPEDRWQTAVAFAQALCPTSV